MVSKKSGRGSAHFEVLLQTAELEQGKFIRLHVCDHDIMGEVDKVNVHIWHHVLMSLTTQNQILSDKVLKVVTSCTVSVNLCLCKVTGFQSGVSQ